MTKRQQILPYPDADAVRRIELMAKKDESLRSKRVLHFLAQQPKDVRNAWISLTYPMLTRDDFLKIMKHSNDSK